MYLYHHDIQNIVYIERDIRRVFQRGARNYGIVALVGARQTGKTTFLRHHMRDHDARYVLFDDLVARTQFNDEFKQFELEYVAGTDLTVLDEVQYGTEAGTKLKYLVDTGNRLWITSSSELLLAKPIPVPFRVGTFRPPRRNGVDPSVDEDAEFRLGKPLGALPRVERFPIGFVLLCLGQYSVCSKGQQQGGCG